MTHSLANGRLIEQEIYKFFRQFLASLLLLHTGYLPDQKSG